MFQRGLLVLMLGLAPGAWRAADAADCYDVSKGEPQTLTGKLDTVVFPGPPNYKDVQGGDAPEPTFVLRLAAPICITGDRFADATKPFAAVQVQETEATAGQLRSLLGQTVTLQLTGPMAAQTGHHHEPLVAGVASTRTADASPPVSVEFAPPSSTVRAFYEALGRGDGTVASLMIAPESRRVPAFSPGAMSRFYGAMRQPLQLVSIDRSGPDAYVVAYNYVSDARACDGRAEVTTRSQAGVTYIVSIRALSGC